MKNLLTRILVICLPLASYAVWPFNAAATEDATLRQISDLFEKTWNQPPFPAARGMCVEAWGRMAALGDEQAHDRLVRLAKTNGDEYRCAAVKSLIGAGDKNICDHLTAIAIDTTAPRQERLAALVIGSQCVSNAIPPEAERLACEEAANPRSEKGMYQLLVKYATEQSRVALEAALLRALPHGKPAVIVKYGCVGGNAQENPSLCRVGWALAALKHVHNAQSIPVIRRAVELPLNSEWSFERINALQTLCELGDRAYALRRLEEAYEQETDPEVQVYCAGALVDVGERSYLQKLRAGMESPLEPVRERTYLIIFSQNDGSYSQKASHDYSPTLNKYHSPGYVAFWNLTSSLETSFPDHARDYLLQIAKDGATTEARCVALSELLQWCPRLTGDEILPICRKALAEPAPSLPREFPKQAPWPDKLRDLERAWQYTGVSLVAVVRFGNPEERKAALSALESMLQNAQSPQRDSILLDFLQVCNSVEALPLLKSGLREDRTPLARIKAATSVLAILQTANKAGAGS